MHYDKNKNQLNDKGCAVLLIQTYQYYLGCLLIEEYEKNHQMKFDYIVRWRDRLFSYVKLDVTNINSGLYFIKSPSTTDISKLDWVCEGLFYGKRDYVIDLIKNWMDTVGSFRLKNGNSVYCDRRDKIDRCFAAERHFAMFLTNSQSQIFWWNVKLINSCIDKSIIENQQEYTIT